MSQLYYKCNYRDANACCRNDDACW